MRRHELFFYFFFYRNSDNKGKEFLREKHKSTKGTAEELKTKLKKEHINHDHFARARLICTQFSHSMLHIYAAKRIIKSKVQTFNEYNNYSLELCSESSSKNRLSINFLLLQSRNGN